MANENEFAELVSFLGVFFQNHFKQTLDISTLTKETLVENDLMIGGLDADFFLTDLVTTFKLDASDFDGDKYFSDEGLDFIFPLLRFFLGQKKWMPTPKEKKVPLTLGMLEQCIKNGKLV
ncbi:DUF1493 family protein [Chitinophagaceae bacterium 26-R-25]|nr:DUF1493 family protein [Chitinophagaceae bacterium 26-R-25]